MNTWTQKHYEQFSTASYDESKGLAINILFHTGIRLGELSALTPADILPTMHIDVNKTYVASDKDGSLMPPKTHGSQRCISIPQSLYCKIQKYVSTYRIKEDCRLFSFAKASLQNYINTISKQERLPIINIHAFRHAYIRSLHLKDLPSSETATWSGLKKDMDYNASL